MAGFRVGMRPRRSRKSELGGGEEVRLRGSCRYGGTAFACVDARYAEQQADCIVTNLPYGVYCHLEKDALRAVLQNLGSLAPRATWITSERIEDDLLREGYAIERVVSVDADRFERRLYVTRSPAA